MKHLARRLGISLWKKEDGLLDRESLEMDPLLKWGITNQVLTSLLAGANPDQAFAQVVASGGLPSGAQAELAFNDALPGASVIAEQTTGLIAGRTEEYRDVRLSLGDEVLSGRIHGRYGPDLIGCTVSKPKPDHRVALWIRHLALCCSAPEHRCAHWISKGGYGPVEVLSLARPDSPAAELAKLIALYRAGQCEPLLFLPVVSWAYFSKLNSKKGTPDAASNAARQAYKRVRDGDAVYLRQFFAEGCFADQDFSAGELPSTEALRFEALASAIFGPIKEAEVGS